MKKSALRDRLLLTTIIAGAIGGAVPARAQDAPPAEAPQEAAQDDIVVTGSLFARADRETASPLTTMSAET
ncbi:MAG: hypothetical protein JSS15_01865, partial [Proteobacteria bacterium]|nr:hypothetical protein [Pseudomonadota bacterium]